MRHGGEFSEAKLEENGQFDVDAYTDVITAFYEKHPTCRDFPIPFLLQNLNRNMPLRTICMRWLRTVA